MRKPIKKTIALTVAGGVAASAFAAPHEEIDLQYCPQPLYFMCRPEQPHPEHGNGNHSQFPTVNVYGTTTSTSTTSTSAYSIGDFLSSYRR